MVAIGTASDARKLEVFYETNASVYKETVDDIYNGVVSSEGGLLSLENMQQIDAFSNAIQVERCAVVSYNKKLKAHRYWQDHFAMGIFHVNVSDDIDYIK